jgi:hypothetical protein
MLDCDICVTLLIRLEENKSRQGVGEVKKLEEHVTFPLVNPSWEQVGQEAHEPNHSITSGPRYIPRFQGRYNSISERR